MSQVVPISLGSALSTTLDNYYALLKAQVGGLQSEEYLQLKLVADPVDINDATYRYWSMYNLLIRSDLGIEPRPVSGTVVTSATRFSDVYGAFMRRLRSYAIVHDLTPAQQAQVADYDVQMDHARNEAMALVLSDYSAWKTYCDITGSLPGDKNAFIQWSVNYGHGNQIDTLFQQVRTLLFQQRTILNIQYADPDDQLIVNADNEFNQVQMRLRYPMFPDYQYSDQSQFSLTYLANLPAGSTCLFDDRRALSWNVTVANMKTTTAGNFTAHWDHSTGTSTSIATDWGASGSASYFVVSANVNASSQTQIQEDFQTTTALDLGAASAYKAQILYPGWFHPELFSCHRLQQHIGDFADFFGANGSLLYYPTHLVLVRGFSAQFSNSQNWSYDYVHNFQASVGGGFSICGISFGSSANYGSHVHEHQVEQATTSLKFADDPSTLRFVGYVVKKNAIMHNVYNLSPVSETGEVLNKHGYIYPKDKAK